MDSSSSRVGTASRASVPISSSLRTACTRASASRWSSDWMRLSTSCNAWGVKVEDREVVDVGVGDSVRVGVAVGCGVADGVGVGVGWTQADNSKIVKAKLDNQRKIDCMAASL